MSAGVHPYLVTHLNVIYFRFHDINLSVPTTGLALAAAIESMPKLKELS